MPERSCSGEKPTIVDTYAIRSTTGREHSRWHRPNVGGVSQCFAHSDCTESVHRGTRPGDISVTGHARNLQPREQHARSIVKRRGPSELRGARACIYHSPSLVRGPQSRRRSSAMGPWYASMPSEEPSLPERWCCGRTVSRTSDPQISLRSETRTSTCESTDMARSSSRRSSPSNLCTR